jgi:hypothetical protein
MTPEMRLLRAIYGPQRPRVTAYHYGSCRAAEELLFDGICAIVRGQIPDPTEDEGWWLVQPLAEKTRAELEGQGPPAWPTELPHGWFSILPIERCPFCGANLEEVPL